MYLCTCKRSRMTKHRGRTNLFSARTFFPQWEQVYMLSPSNVSLIVTSSRDSWGKEREDMIFNPHYTEYTYIAWIEVLIKCNICSPFSLNNENLSYLYKYSVCFNPSAFSRSLDLGLFVKVRTVSTRRMKTRQDFYNWLMCIQAPLGSSEHLCTY